MVLNSFPLLLDCFENLFQKNFVSWNFLEILSLLSRGIDSPFNFKKDSFRNFLNSNFGEIIPQDLTKIKTDKKSVSDMKNYFPKPKFPDSNRKPIFLRFLSENAEKIQIKSLTAPEKISKLTQKLQHMAIKLEIGKTSVKEKELLESLQNLDSSRGRIAKLFKSQKIISKFMTLTKNQIETEIAKNKKIFSNIKKDLLVSVWKETHRAEKFIIPVSLEFEEQISYFFTLILTLSAEISICNIESDCQEILKNIISTLAEFLIPPAYLKSNWDKLVYKILNAKLQNRPKKFDGFYKNSAENNLPSVLRFALDLIVPQNKIIHQQIGSEKEMTLPAQLNLKYIFCRNHFPEIFGFRILSIESSGHSVDIAKTILLFQK